MPAKRLATKPVWLEPTARLDVVRPLTGPKINRLAGSRVELESLIEIESVARARKARGGSHDGRMEEMMEKVPMTAGGYAALEVELKQRQSVERPRIIEHIAEARSHGDLSENAEYHAAKEEQSHNEGRIAELEDKLARADIIDISKLSGDTVKFGATVTLVDEDTDKKAVWQIVGEPEADAKKGRISITSPLARALIGKKKGTSVEVMAPGGAKAYEITKVEWR
jgi:transcription elongation factor GreA